jgi:hypothetical protein
VVVESAKKTRSLVWVVRTSGVRPDELTTYAARTYAARPSLVEAPVDGTNGRRKGSQHSGILNAVE